MYITLKLKKMNTLKPAYNNLYAVKNPLNNKENTGFWQGKIWFIYKNVKKCKR
jgi:hypothetical protein